MSTLTILGSDHPDFRHGSKARAEVTNGQLTQLARYRVNSVEGDGVHIIVRTALEYMFVVSRSEYVTLLGNTHETPDRVPA